LDRYRSTIFKVSTDKLAQVFKVNTDKQRIDSVHKKSNMLPLGHIGIFSESIHKFLKNLKRGQKEQFDAIDKKIVDRYLSKDALGCFSRVKPSDSKKTLSHVSRDLFDLVQQFKGRLDVTGMYSYQLLERVLSEHCNLTGDTDNPVELKNSKEIPSDSLQNPSDPDATYCASKNAGCMNSPPSLVIGTDGVLVWKPLNLSTTDESRSVLCYFESTWCKHLPGCCLPGGKNDAQRGRLLGVMSIGALIFVC